MPFYGVPDDDDMQAIRVHAQAIIDIYTRNNQPVLNADNMLLAMRSTNFMSDPKFNDAIQQHCRNADGEVINDNIVKFWRLHVFTWCCSQALRLPGDFVECGVHMGLYSRTMMQTLDFANAAREMYLYDTFEGLSAGQSTPREREQVEGVYDIPQWEEEVRQHFAPWPNARVIRGRVPEVLGGTAPERVAFLHLDMNSARAERAAFDFFQPRLSPGALILMDDFGRAENIEIGLAHDQAFTGFGRRILELPTGQGLVIWN
jgi:hypothetical protein